MSNSDGNHAQGAWLGISIGIKGPAFGYDTICVVSVRFLIFNQEFVREDGVWKFYKFNAKTLFEAPEWQFDPATNAGLISHNRCWHYPPDPTSNGTASDFQEIENIQGYWVHTLKCNKSGELVEQVVAFENPEVEYHTHDPFMEAKSFTLERTNNPVVGAIGIENFRIKARELDTMFSEQGHHVGSHITTTPYIEVHEDGVHATAFFLDFGWTLLAEAFHLPPEKWAANPSLGRYAQEMVKDSNGQWRILKFNFYPVFRLMSMWPFKDEKIRGWAGSGSGDSWPKPFESYVNDNL